ncbi:MAG: nitrite/sulfite reductase [Candidatus Omnitrophota bacterium]|nr:nitrite/sulfite reductase [Candidatus Omnitrophota bacterium]MDZ4242594.1 nitrite/sulfite reductase [Candidatus Omnitrophota bacterium]
MKKPFTPNLKTPLDLLCKEELNKQAQGLHGAVSQEFRDISKADISWETEQIAKSHGVYLEFNRAKTGEEKHWMYLIRISNPGGGPITREQWRLFDELSDKHTKDTQGIPSLRLTNRQNIQFHWVSKQGVLEIVKKLAEAGKRSINGCGDNTRNVMGCPLSRSSDIFDANAWAQKAGAYFQLPLDPYIEVWALDPKYIRKPEESFSYGPRLLNRKFKLAFSTVHKDPHTGKIVPDNCVEALTNDMAVVPIVDNGKVSRFQIYIGGGQGERNGKPSMASLAQPLAIVSEKQLFQVLDAVVHVHEEWGDRQNRFWARIKYVVKKMGTDWYRQQVEARLGVKLDSPDLKLDYGARHLHFGWTLQPKNGLYAYGAFIENGRVTDASPNGKLKTMIREIMEKYPVELSVTPNQDALFTNVPQDARADFEADLKKHGFGLRNGKTYSHLRLHSGACVGRDTCRLTYTDSEKFEPFLVDELEKMGWADMAESIGITGCERQCFRPATKTIGLVGSGMDRYQLKLMGSESARHQGVPLLSAGGQGIYLRSIPREKVAAVIDALFRFYKANAKPGEDMGAYHHRIGMDAIIQHLKENPATAPLMLKPFPADCVIE